MIRAAVIGCGRMGAFTSEAVRRHAPACWLPLSHADAIAAQPDLELAALCDTDPANLARARAAHGGVPGYSDYRVLSREVRPDLVAIATRTIGRADIVKTFHGDGTRAFHVEKPLCNSVAELVDLEALLAASDVYLTYGTVRRFFASTRQALAIVESGRIGALREIRVNMGAGAMFWTHPHSVDWILMAAGSRVPTAVQAVLGDIVADDVAGAVANDPLIRSATIWFDDGVAGHIGVSPGADLILAGETGIVSVIRDGREVVIDEARGDDPYLIREPFEAGRADGSAQGTLAPITQIVRCLARDRDAIDANARVRRDILLGQRILFAMVESHRRLGAMVSPFSLNPELTIWARTGSRHA